MPSAIEAVAISRMNEVSLHTCHGRCSLSACSGMVCATVYVGRLKSEMQRPARKIVAGLKKLGNERTRTLVGEQLDQQTV